MCGLAGFYNLSKQNFAVDEKLLFQMQESITHRGPDSYGIWKSDNRQLGLAFRRLSIIDISETGNQPMHSNDQTITICFNGEIYNYKELRKELEALGFLHYSNSDSETIINAYKAWGIEGIHRLEGMFAIVLYDDKKKMLYLIRDRIGVKPLYFSLQNGILSFASEIKSLWKLPWIKKKINQLAWYHYLTFMVPPAPMTIFQEIYKLPAGFFAQVDEHKKVSFHEWYTPIKSISKSEKQQYNSEQFCIEKIHNLLISSTKKRMIADVPVGSFLSGGVDSSLNVALMSQFNSKIKTFTIAFSENKNDSELNWARQIANKFSTDHHELIISEKDAFEYYKTMVNQLDEPLADCVCIPLYYVSKMARDAGMKVVQIGEGADELFFGYPLYANYYNVYNKLWKPTTKFLPQFARKFLSHASNALLSASPFKKEIISNWAGNRALFWGGALAFGENQKQNMLKSHLLKDMEPDPIISLIYPNMKQTLDSHNIVNYHLQRLKEIDPQADFAKQMLYIELKHRLPELLLMRVDKMSMATSLEAREPFLDHHLIEFMLQVPQSLKFANQTTKYLLKKVAEKYLPASIIHRKKVGFGAPTSHWFSQGKYFPTHFQNITKNNPTKFINPVDAKTNTNASHRAVQNWVLQQMSTFYELYF